MARPIEHDDQIVYRVRCRQTSAGLAITIPIDVVRVLDLVAGDSMHVIPMDDGRGFVVTREAVNNGAIDEASE
jgi:hypothetical protein